MAYRDRLDAAELGEMAYNAILANRMQSAGHEATPP